MQSRWLFYSHQAIMPFLPLLLDILVLVCSATSDIRYVRPADFPLSSCPGQPCLTLHEYVKIDNFTNGTTLKFLPGNHTLKQSFSLEDISNVTFEAATNHSVTNIICKDDVTFHCDSVTHLHIIGLTFMLSQRGDIINCFRVQQLQICFNLEYSISRKWGDDWEGTNDFGIRGHHL